MKEFFLFVLASIGLCHFLVDSALMVPIKDGLTRLGLRQLVKMLNCYQCAGFWSGVAMGLVTWIVPRVPWIEILLYGFAASFLGPLAAVFIGYLNTQVAAATADGRGVEVGSRRRRGGRCRGDLNVGKNWTGRASLGAVRRAGSARTSPFPIHAWSLRCIRRRKRDIDEPRFALLAGWSPRRGNEGALEIFAGFRPTCPRSASHRRT